MAVLDPFDMLVRLGKVSQANLQAADLVEAGVGTSTRAARLVAIGVDREKLLKDLSDLTRMPIASREVLASLAPMKLPASYSRAMKEFLAVPIGRVDEHILDVAIADPRTTTKLRDAAIAHRPHLALEDDILAALTRVFPDYDVLDPISEPTLKNVPLAPRPVSVHDGAAHAEPTHDGTPQGDEEPRNDVQPAPANVAAPAPSDVEPTDVEPTDVEPIGDEEPPPQLQAMIDVAPAREKAVSPFKKTMVHAEVTERVRERHREQDEHDEHASDPNESSTPSSPSSPSSPPPFEQRARAIVALTRERIAASDARTRGIAALIGVFALAALVAVAVLAASDDDDTSVAAAVDAGVAPVVDAGDPMATQLSTTPPTPVVEKLKKPKKPKQKQKRKPSRTKRKTQPAR